MQLDSTDEKREADVTIEEKREASSTEDPYEEFGGYEERQRLERKLLWKIDCRMSILVVIYVLNYVRARRVDGHQC